MCWQLPDEAQLQDRVYKSSLMRHAFLFSCIALLTLSFRSIGQDATPLKRTPYRLTVAVDKKTTYEEDIKGTAYVLPNNTIQLYPGETVYIEVKQVDGKIETMTAVSEIRDSAITMTISFSQSVKKKVHEMTMLQVKNPFSNALVYKATIYLLKHRKWVDTDVYPVQAKLSAFEMWPDVITSIGLGEWEFKTN